MSLIIEILFLIVITLILIVNFGVRRLYKNLIEEENKTKLSGVEVAREVSSIVSNEEPHIIKKRGKFLDNYNYERNVIRLSEEVFDGTNIYASIIAINIALETDPKRTKIAKGHKFSSFIVLASYLVITIGAFINNSSIIHFGLILFIGAFILELLLIDSFAKSEEELKEVYSFLEDEKIIKPYESSRDYMVLLILINVARLPYGFINYFR